jgi:hypothetical protein
MAEKLVELDLSPRVEKISLHNKTPRHDSRGTQRKNHGKLLERRAQKQHEEEGEEFRQLLCSPAPMKFAVDTDSVDDFDISSDGAEKKKYMFPHITVQKCEEKLPPITKRQASPPPYLDSSSRSGSSNSLEIPSPLLERRSVDGKNIVVLTPGNLLNTYSKSEGCLHSKHVERGKSPNLLEASLYQTKSQTLSVTTPLIVTGKSSSRPSSRSTSPVPRDMSRNLYKY